MKNKLITLACLVLCLSSASCGSNPTPDPTPATYTVMFDGNSGKLVSGNEIQKVTSASQIVAPVYEREGYTFDGWDKDLATIVTDALVKAQWVVSPTPTTEFTVTFNGNGGTLVSGNEVQKVSSASQIVAPTYTREGYTFNGWDKDLTVITSDTTVNAKWELSPTTGFTVTFNGNGGTLVSGNEVQVVEDASELIPPIYSKDGYTFKGWDKDLATIVASTTVNALWRASSTNPIANYTTELTMKGDSFKVLNLADIQVTNGDDLTLTYHIIDTLIKEQNPDLIVVLGDTINDSTSYDSDQSAINVFNKIDSYDIPWAPIFGNHDTLDYTPQEPKKKTVGTDYLMNIFSNSDNCLFIKGPSSARGYSNYMIHVNDTKGDLVEALIFLDSYTNGLNSTNEQFYADCLGYSKEINDNVMPSSVVFSHVPINEYLDSYNKSLDIECQDVKGVLVSEPLSAGENTMFNTIKTLGSTKTMICGHDHENQFILDREGIKLAYGMKSSDGDDDNAHYNFKHPLGGLVLTIDGTNPDKLEYDRVEDIAFTVKNSNGFDFHPGELPFWRTSKAKLAFDVKLPSSGNIQFNIQGTNLLRSGQSMKYRKGAWNRLSTNIELTAGSSPSVDCGKLTQLEGNIYHYETDLSAIGLNTDSGEVSYGDETARLIYFHDTVGDFELTNIHWVYEEVTETNQVDLSTAVIANIDDQFTKDLHVKPKPKVTLNGATLKEGTDFVYSYRNNDSVGTATLTIVPSGDGAHRYKGSASKTFKIWRGVLRTSASNPTEIIPCLVSSGGYVTIDYKYVDPVTDATNGISLFLGSDSTHRFGNFKLFHDRLETTYPGVTFSKLDDGYNRIVFDISKLTTVRGDETAPTEISQISFRWFEPTKGCCFDISSQSFANNRGVCLNKPSKLDLNKSYTVSEGGTIVVDYKFADPVKDSNNAFTMFLGSDSTNRFGGYNVQRNSLGATYPGVTFEKLDDLYFRITFDISKLTSVRKDETAPTIISQLSFKWFEPNYGVYFDVNPNESKSTTFQMTDDEFVVANFTDIHVTSTEPLTDTSNTGKTVKYGVQDSNPDIMVFSGDIAGNATQFDSVCTYLDQFKIPYFFIMGNHDHQYLDYSKAQARVNESKYGYMEQGPDALESKGNYTIKIKNSDGELVHALILMDSGNVAEIDESKVEYVTNKVDGVKYGTYNDKSTYCDKNGTKRWDGIHGVQIDWYESQVNTLKCDNSLICHIPFSEYVKAYEQYMLALKSADPDAIAACAPIGECRMGEPCTGSLENFGFFDRIVNTGRTKNVICGHDHLNDFSLMYQGVRLTYAVKTGDGAYWKKDGTICGYTKLTIGNTGSTSIDQRYYNPLA